MCECAIWLTGPIYSNDSLLEKTHMDLSLVANLTIHGKRDYVLETNNITSPDMVLCEEANRIG